MTNKFDIHEWRIQQALRELEELSAKQQKIAKAAPPEDKITGDDFTWETVKAAVIDAAKTLNKRVIYSHNCWWFTDEIAFEVNI